MSGRPGRYLQARAEGREERTRLLGVLSSHGPAVGRFPGF